MTVIDFVKNHDVLREDHRQNEGIAQFDHVDIAKRINQIDKTSLLALVGPYGSGKSLALDQARTVLDKVKWLQFDAWRYPERKALWDGLIIEIAKQIGQERRALRRIDGHKSALGRWGGVVPEIFANVADLIPSGAQAEIKEHVSITWFDRFMRKKDDTKDMGGTAEKIAKNLFDKSPANRVYEFERILSDLLISIKEEKIVIVVEDVDRSGVDGINFLETLNFYLGEFAKNHKTKTVIAIAPVSRMHYEANEDSYLKFATFVEFFHPRMIDLSAFISSAFKDMDPHTLQKKTV